MHRRHLLAQPTLQLRWSAALHGLAGNATSHVDMQTFTVLVCVSLLREG